MNRRASVRLSLHKPIIHSEKTGSDTVPVEKKTKRMSGLKSRKSILTTKENDISAIPVEQETCVVIEFKNSNNEVSSETKKKRKLPIELDLTELTISDKSDNIQPEIKHRRLSTRLALKRSLHSNEETESDPVKTKMNKLSQLKFRKSIVTMKGNDIEATIIEEESQKTPTVIDFNNSNIMDGKLVVEPSEKRKNRRTSIKLGLPELIISEKSDIVKKIKHRRSSLKKPLQTNEESVPKKRRKKRVSICMPTKSTKDLSSEKNKQPLDSRGSRRNLVKNTSDCEDITQIEKYYLDQTVKKKNTPLETIFEENSNSNILIGKKKTKRFIPFSEINKQKDRKNYQCQKLLTARKIKSVKEALKSIQDDSDKD